MTIRLVSCMNVNFCSNINHRDHMVDLLCMNVSYFSDLDHHDHKVGVLYEC